MIDHNKKDAAEALHQFEVVCRTALKLARLGGHANGVLRNGSGGLMTLGEREFGLSKAQIKYCLARARNFMLEAREMERARNKAALKVQATPWAYL